MLRSLAVAVIAIAAVSAVAPREVVHAQPKIDQPQFSYPLDIGGATPGVTIEIILNGQKQGDAIADAAGNADWVLNLVGKSQVTIYVDVCQDGKVVKVMFVAGSGQTPPEDQRCRRRIVAVSFRSDCGVTQITLDFKNWGAQVIGCGGAIYTKPQFYGPVGALLVALPFVTGGSDAPTATASATPAVVSPPTSTAPPTTAPPSTTPPSTTPPATPPTPPPPVDFTVTITVTSWDHVSPGQFSDACGRFATNPAQANAPFVVVASGNGVTQPSVSGTTNASGVGIWRNRINQFGPVTFNVSVTSNGQTRSATGNTNVNGSPNTCPGAGS